MSNNLNNNEKGRLRKLALSGRDALSAAERGASSAAIARRLLSLKELEHAGLIMCYRAFRSEVDTTQLVENLCRMGKTLCFPRCEKGGIMHAYSPNDESAWKKSSFGIMEPDTDNSSFVDPAGIDIVICPLVAFDDKKRRIGYGGGYYDRYLPLCKKALRVGIAFQAQKLECVPTDGHDLDMDIIITEQRLYL